jgi:hypothetical protein
VTDAQRRAVERLFDTHRGADGVHLAQRMRVDVLRKPAASGPAAGDGAVPSRANRRQPAVGVIRPGTAARESSSCRAARAAAGRRRR